MIDNLIIETLFGGSEKSRIQRFQDKYKTNKEMDRSHKDAEIIQSRAYEMLMDDLDKIRLRIANSMMESMASRFEVEKKFQVERSFFTDKLVKTEDCIR